MKSKFKAEVKLSGVAVEGPNFRLYFCTPNSLGLEQFALNLCESEKFLRIQGDRARRGVTTY